MNSMVAGRIILRQAKDKPVRQRHPWIFSGAIRKVEGEPAAGAVVEVVSSDGAWLAYAEYSPHSQIRARVFAWEQNQRLGADFWQRRIVASIERRKQLLPKTEARRLVFAESDGIPGLIVDQYGPHLVMQTLTAGAERRKTQTVQVLADYLRPRSISERDDPVRKKEGLPPSEGVLWGEVPRGRVTITEGDQRFLVDLRSGQKTGFYLDQAQNRIAVASYCGDAQVLNAFSYTGAFAVHALAASARHVTNIDSSEEALELAAANL
ncbi:MAG: class I SAM-dependent rRNA methyltransferase, partial [Chloroflexi bacterium]|nr:class I SAM-dependent rRNA methyltransferase [Chloroflexota bacterium]